MNHNGSLETALKMVDAAVEAGADYIKFQTFKTESLVTGNCRAADYQKANAGAEGQAEMLRKLELSYEDFRRLNDYCRIKGIGFLSTPFDEDSIRFVASLNPDYIKVPSGEITNLPYLRKIAETRLPVIISTGMSTLRDIRAALMVFAGKYYTSDKITLLHCTTEYPCPFEDVNLRAMETIGKQFGLPIGYSDHTRGIAVPIAAVAIGAVMIEKHFTLSRQMEGPDHAASLEPSELTAMVRSIREVEAAMGSKEKMITPSESKNIAAARRSIVASRFIPAGKIIEEEDLAAKRPGNGISPIRWEEVVGSRAIRDFHPDQQIEL